MANVGNNETDSHIFFRSETITETHKSDYSFSDSKDVNPKRALTQNPSKNGHQFVTKFLKEIHLTHFKF